MLKNELLQEVLGVAMSSGGDFAEVYAEHTRSNNIQFVDGKIDKISDNVLSGVGIRIFLGERTVYASTSDVTREGLLACARSAADALGEGKGDHSANDTAALAKGEKTLDLGLACVAGVNKCGKSCHQQQGGDEAAKAEIVLHYFSPAQTEKTHQHGNQPRTVAEKPEKKGACRFPHEAGVYPRNEEYKHENCA